MLETIYLTAATPFNFGLKTSETANFSAPRKKGININNIKTNLRIMDLLRQPNKKKKR